MFQLTFWGHFLHWTFSRFSIPWFSLVPSPLPQEENHCFWLSHKFTGAGIEIGEIIFPFHPDSIAELGLKSRFSDSGASGLSK